MYRGFGQIDFSSDPHYTGNPDYPLKYGEGDSAWYVDRAGHVGQGFPRRRSPSDPPYKPFLWDINGGKLFYNIVELRFYLSPEQRALQTDFSAEQREAIFYNDDRKNDIYAAGGGPWRSEQGTFSPSPWGRDYADDSALINDPNWVKAQGAQYSIIMSGKTGGRATPSLDDVEFMEPTAEPIPTMPPQVIDYGGIPVPQPPAVTYVSPTTPADYIGVPDLTVIPSQGEPSILPSAADVFSPLPPAQAPPLPGGAAAAEFPLWGWIGLGILAIAAFRK